MSGWQRFRRRLNALLYRGRIEAAMDEEMRIHVEMEAEHLERTHGLGSAEARRRALVAFGGVERAKEQSRDARGTRWLEDLVQDARLGLRSLRRSPGFAAVAIVTLVLGLGATTAMFSVVKAVLLTPLPYPASDRIVVAWSRFLPESGFDFPESPLSPPEYFDLAEQAKSLGAVAAHTGLRATLLDGDGRGVPVRGSRTTANLFDVLKVQPMLGRGYTAAEDAAGAAASVAVLGHGLWQRAFGGDPAILGRTVRVNGQAAEVIGVMPPGFAYPTDETELWTPLGLDPAQRDNRASHFLAVTARLADGADLGHAHTELATLMTQWRAQFPEMHTGHIVFLRALLDEVVGGARSVLVTLLAAVALVLLIVCVNVANLLLARGEVRRGELAVRSALGAGRTRLLRQFFAEGLVLSLIGAAGGLVLAHVLVGLTVALGAASIPRHGAIAIDAGVLLFTTGIALLATFMFSAAPALHAAARAPRLALGEQGRVTSGQALRVRRALVATQIALSTVVAVGAGLTVRSFRELVTVDPGFRTEAVLLADLTLPAGDYPEAGDVVAFYTALLERLRSEPGATDVTATTTLPLLDAVPNIDFEIEDMAPPGPGQPAHSGDFVIAAPRLLDVLNVRLLEGRFFEPGDDAGSLPVVVVNRRLARTFWPDQSALGKRIRMAGNDTLRWLHVVGVVDDVQFHTLADDMRPAWYVPLAQMAVALPQPARSFTIALGSAGDPEALLAQAVRNTVRAADATLPVIRMRTLQRVVHDAVARPRFTMSVLGLFALLALVLGAVGVYGLLAYTVAQRGREFGIRIALGADAHAISRLVAAEGLRLALAGLVFGLVGAFLATRLMRNLLFGVSAHDPATYGAVGGLLCLVVLAATVVPVARVLRANPARALRAE